MNTISPLFKNRKLIYTLFIAQLTLSIICALLFFIFKDLTSSVFSLIGSGCWLIPSLFFTLNTARKLKPGRSGISNPTSVLMSFYLGEIGKFFLSIVLIMLSILLLPVIILPFLSGYISSVAAIFTLPIYFLLAKNNN